MLRVRDSLVLSVTQLMFLAPAEDGEAGAHAQMELKLPVNGRVSKNDARASASALSVFFLDLAITEKR